MSSIVNKVKDALHHDKHSEGTREGEHGPHHSKAANAADPRVGSDRDHRAAPSHHTNPLGSHGATGGAFGSGPAQNTTGPHNSDALNKVDPRVDSDPDGSRRIGAATGTTTTTTAHHQHQGIGGQHAHATPAGGAFGSGGGAFGSGGARSGVTGYDDPEGTHGPHGSRAANALDPRVDSDADRRGTHATSGFGTGPARNTAGPHTSDALNKADPRVDSDLDGSKTVGGNKTFQA